MFQEHTECKKGAMVKESHALPWLKVAMPDMLMGIESILKISIKQKNTFARLTQILASSNAVAFPLFQVAVA